MSTLQERLRSMAASVDGVSEGLAAELVDFLRQAADALDAAERRIRELEAQAQELRVELEATLAQREQAERERDLLQGALDAHDERLREAEARVWSDGTTWGCDAPEQLADAVLGLRERAEQAERELAEARAREQRLVEALEHVLPYVEHFRGGWSTHTHGGYNSGELADQIKDVLSTEVCVRGEVFTDADLRRAGQDWRDSVAIRPIGGESGGGERR